MVVERVCAEISDHLIRLLIFLLSAIVGLPSEDHPDIPFLTGHGLYTNFFRKVKGQSPGEAGPQAKDRD